VNRRKSRVQTPDVSRYPAPALVDDFVLLFLPSCGPHLTPLAIGSLESGLLVSPLLRGPEGIDLSRPLFTCTNANQAATCTRNTRPRVSPHHVVNHSSQLGATIHRSSDAPVLNLPLDECSKIADSSRRGKRARYHWQKSTTKNLGGKELPNA
jgi:hypothetical protein